MKVAAPGVLRRSLALLSTRPSVIISREFEIMLVMTRAIGRAVALLAIALIVGMCLGVSVEASSGAHHECNALTDGQTILSKPLAASLGLVGIPAEAVRLVMPASAVNQPPAYTVGSASAAPPGGPPARSPPASH